MKKRKFALMILALVMNSAVSGAVAEAGADLNLLSAQLTSGQLRVTSAIAWQDGLLIKADRGLYFWEEGQTEAALVLKLDHGWLGQKEDPDFFDILLRDGEVIYALHSGTGTLRSVSVEGETVTFGEKTQLDWQHFIQEGGTETYVFPPQDLILSEGRLYMLAPNEFDAFFHLVSLDINGGPLVRHDDQAGENLRSFASYRGNELLLVSGEEIKDQQGQSQSLSILSAFNTGTNKLHQIGILDFAPPFGAVPLAFNAGDDAIYYAGSDTLYRVTNEGEAVPCAKLTGSGISKLILLADGRLAAISPSGILIRSDHPDELNNRIVLRVAGHLDSQVLQLVQAQLPDLDIQQAEGLNTNEQLVESMLTGTPAVDIYMLDSDQHAIESMIAKGYLLSLPKGSPADEAERASRDMMRRVLEYDDTAYALPIGFDFPVAQHHILLLDETELTSPSNFTSYCKTLDDWSKGLFDHFPEYRLSGNPKEKAEAYRLAFRLYRDHMRQSGEEWSFDTALFRSIIDMAGQLDTSELDDLPNPEDMFDDILNIREMITNSADYQPSMEHERLSLASPFDLILYALEPGGAPLGRGRLTALAVSSRSASPQAALLFINAYAQMLPAQTKALLSAQWEGAVENPSYESEVDRYRYLIADVQGMIDSALARGAKAVPEYEADLAYFQTVLAEAETTLRYLLTEEEVNIMRDRLAHVYIPTELQRLEDRGGIDELFGQYIQGALPLEQFIEDADSRLRLIRLESK
jgi:hypothetical protein